MVCRKLPSYFHWLLLRLLSSLHWFCVDWSTLEQGITFSYENAVGLFSQGKPPHRLKGREPGGGGCSPSPWSLQCLLCAPSWGTCWWRSRVPGQRGWGKTWGAASSGFSLQSHRRQTSQTRCGPEGPVFLWFPLKSFVCIPYFRLKMSVMSSWQPHLEDVYLRCLTLCI